MACGDGLVDRCVDAADAERAPLKQRRERLRRARAVCKALPDLQAIAVMLDLVHHPGPDGGLAARVGTHGGTNPLGGAFGRGMCKFIALPDLAATGQIAAEGEGATR
jgi:hypothetical protein